MKCLLNPVRRSNMMKKVWMSVSAALISMFAASVFASGYGPAPFYTPSQGAPSSQRGMSEQTIAAEQGDQSNAADARFANASQADVAAQAQR
jgi:hypothetical protein